jgi:hypothetical protein
MSEENCIWCMMRGREPRPATETRQGDAGALKLCKDCATLFDLGKAGALEVTITKRPDPETNRD